MSLIVVDTSADDKHAHHLEDQQHVVSLVGVMARLEDAQEVLHAVPQLVNLTHEHSQLNKSTITFSLVVQIVGQYRQ